MVSLLGQGPLYPWISLNHVQVETCSFLYGKTPVLDVNKVYITITIQGGVVC